MSFELNKLDPQYSTIYLPCVLQYTTGGVQVAPTISRQPNAPSEVIMGDGTTAATFPTQRTRRGLLFDGGDYVDLDWTAGGMLDTQTFTVCVLVKAQRPAADGRIFEIGIAGQRYSLYYDLSEDEIVWWKDDTVDQTLTSSFGASYGQMFAVVASISSTGMKLWVEGRLMASVAGDVRLPSFDASTVAYFGQDVAGGNRLKGTIYTAAIYPFELNTPQVREWGRRARQLRTTRSLWTPAELLVGASAGWYWERGDSGLLTFNTLPTLLNADFTDGTNHYTALDSTLSVLNGAGPSGGNALRVTSTAATYWARADGVCISGNRYRVSGYARGDGGVGVPAILDGSAALVWEGTNSTAWQAYSVEFTNGATAMYFGSQRASGVVDFAPITLTENLSLTQVDPTAAVGTLAGASLVQATAAAMPWSDSGALRFDGTSDRMSGSLSAPAYNAFHKDDGTLVCVMYPDTTAVAERCVFSTFGGNSGTNGLAFIFDAGNQRIRFQVGNSSGTLLHNTSTANGSCVRNARHKVTATWNTAGSSVSIDGGTPTTGVASGSPNAGDCLGAMLGALTTGLSPFAGSVEAMFYVNRVLTSAEIAQLEAYWS